MREGKSFIRTGLNLALVVLAAMLAAPSAQGQGTPLTAAYITNSTDLTTGYDQAFVDFLVSLGYTVTPVQSGDVGSGTFSAAVAETYSLVVIAEAIGSSSVDNLKPDGGSTPDVPILHIEAWGWDNWGLDTTANGTWLDGGTTGMTITPAGAAHAIVQEAGLSAGLVTIYDNVTGDANSVFSTKPPATLDDEIVVLATGVGTSAPDARATMWALEAGATESIGSPGSFTNRIVGLAYPPGAGTSLPWTDYSPAAVALFTAAIHWLDPTSVPEPPPTTTTPFEFDPDEDTHVSNDATDDRTGNFSGFSALHVRNHPAPRHRAGFIQFRYTLDAGVVEDTFSSVSLVMARRSDGNGIWTIHGIAEDFDDVDLTAISFLDAPGLANDPDPGVNTIIQLNTAELVTSLTQLIIPITSGNGANGNSAPDPLPDGSQAGSVVSAAMDQFINDDTDGILTFLIMPTVLNATDDTGGLLWSMNNGAAPVGAPYLEGFYQVEGPPNAVDDWMMF